MSDLGLGSVLSGLGDALGQVKPILQDVTQGLGGVIGDLGGLVPPNGPFQQCIATALGGDSSLYAFPQDLLFDLTDLHPYNLDHPHLPAAIVYPRHVEDVSSVVICAHEFGIAVQPRSGGHSYLNFGLGGMDGSLSIEMRNMDDFSYNPSDQTVTFGTGNHLRDLDRQLALIDRVMAYGVVGDIGTGGHIAIGGVGPLSRLLGLAVDQVISAQCVLGDGSIVTASESENPDLLFALKGAAWSFAVITELTMQTSPAPSEVVNFQYNITAGNSIALANAFKRWQAFVTDPQLSRLFASTLTLSNGILIYGGTFFGDEAAFNQLNIDLSLPIADLDVQIVSRVATVLVHELIDLTYDIFGGVPAHFYSKSLKFTPQTLLPDAAVDALFTWIDEADKDTLIWFLVWDLQGGHMADVPQDATAYWHRDASYFFQGYVVNALGPVTQTQRAFLNDLNAFCTQLVPIDESAYAGYVDDELVDPLTAYWGGNVPRLQQIKREYDPWNTFRNPQSIPLS